MKYAILILLQLLCTKVQSKSGNNTVGLGAGLIYYDPFSGYDNKVYVNSFIYGKYQDEFTTISRVTSPNLYFSKTVFKNLRLRLNGAYYYRSFYIDRTGWIIEPGPNYDPNKHYYNNMNYTKTLIANVGLQYDFNIRQLKIYPVLELGSKINHNVYRDYYTYGLNSYTTFKEEVVGTEWIKSLNALFGLEYKLNSRISISYELGLYHWNLSPLSRLSANCFF